MSSSILVAMAAALRVVSALNIRQFECHDVHIFLARGAGDLYPGPMGPIVTPVCQGIASCGSENVQYPGTVDQVCNSITVGVANATNEITGYAKYCPRSKLVLAGYSEVCHRS
jgi:hypothetical protein